jgi:acetyl esterase/lipase
MGKRFIGSLWVGTMLLGLGGSLASSAQAQEPPVFELWPDQPPGETRTLEAEQDFTKPTDNQVAGERVMRIGNVSTPTLTVYRPTEAKANGTAVVICPGGGHHILAWDLEGTEVAEWLNSIGVTALVLKYRVPFRNPDKRWEAAVQDAQRAVSLARNHADKWKINPDRIGILGFSAGGQTAGYTCVLHRERQYPRIDAVDDVSCRPDFAVLVYPAWLVKKDNSALEDVVQVDGDTPPMFFAHAWDDPIRVENSLLMGTALKKAGVPCDIHVYAHGGHGFGLRPTENPCTHWPKACEQWMQRNGWLAP